MKNHTAKQSVWVSVAVNVILAILQIIVGFFARSGALISDGLHTLSDIFADAIVLFAAKHSHAPADKEHPFGHARFENAASFALGAILISVGLGLVWAAGQKLLNPSLIATVHPLAFLVALLTLVAKEALFRYLKAVATRLKSSMLLANAYHARADAASSLVVAVGIAANLLGWPLADPLASLIVGLMIAHAGYGFCVSAFNALTDHGLNDTETEAIFKTLATTNGAHHVHDLRTRISGDYVMVEVHLCVAPYLSVSEGHFIGELAEKRVLAEHEQVTHITVHVDIEHKTQQLEPQLLLTRLDIETALNLSLYPHIQIQLHYINHQIEVDFISPQAQPDLATVAQLRALASTLNAVSITRHFLQQ